MNNITDIIIYSLQTFKMVIAVDIGDKIIIVNPTMLENLDLSDIARSLSAADLTEEELMEGLKVIDTARQPPFPENKKD